MDQDNDGDPLLGDDEDEVVCMECGDAFGQITRSHLKTRHGMNTEEYKSKHPDAALQGEQARRAGGWGDE